MSLGSNITHQVGTSDAERLATCAAKLREVEGQRDALAEALEPFADIASRESVRQIKEWAIVEHLWTAHYYRAAGAALSALPADLLARRAAEREVIEAMRPFARMAHPFPGTQLLVATRDDTYERHDGEHELILTDALFARMWAAWDALAAVDGLGAGEGETTNG